MGLSYFNKSSTDTSRYSATPYGMLMPGRNKQSEEYRYGFQGQEVDNEVKGNGMAVNYKYRMHDPRLGRFFAVDPLTATYPYYSPYLFSGNRLIDVSELEGLEPILRTKPIFDFENKDGYVEGEDISTYNWVGASYSNDQSKIYRSWTDYEITEIKVFDSNEIKGETTGKTYKVLKGAVESFELNGIKYKAHFDINTGEFDGYYSDFVSNSVLYFKVKNLTTENLVVYYPLNKGNESFWGDDYDGFFQNATEADYDACYTCAVTRDIATMLANNFTPLGPIDNAVATTSDPNATTTEKVLSWLPVIFMGKGGAKSSGRIAPTKIQEGTQIDISKFTNKQKNKKYHDKSGWYIEKDYLGDESHGGSAYKLFNKKGKRVWTLDKDGKVLRK